MAEDAVDHATVLGGLVERPCVTRELDVHNPGSHDDDAGWFARHEMARTVEDVLARRTRLLFLDVHAALERAPEVARQLARELGRDEAWQKSELSAFAQTAEHFRLPS